MADKEGTLRFIGNVLFSSGIWCGIQLRAPIGKNDGSVLGVRYFHCPPDHGLMAPLSKVILLDEDCCLSGPHSILCGLDTKTDVPKNNTTYTFHNNEDDDDDDDEAHTIILNGSSNISSDDNNRTVTYNYNRTFIVESEPPPSNLNSPMTSLQRPFDFSTPLLNTTITKLTHSTPEDKRDSIEFEESLGILTPDQMMDATNFASSRTPSSEKLNSLPQNSQMDSLGIIDEKMLAGMELPLDSVGKFKDFVMARVEQTPSPEELPLDNTPVLKSDEMKKTNNTFIVSISSITSLDTGYQGDGEMSRPASRGADNSPMTRRPLPRRNDPMTDSDFYTESDADNHEEHLTSRGDRRARIIDGTLYGVDPQAAADLYANNRENMDSSGVFTDIETNTNELNKTLVPSPSGSSTKTISSDSQNNHQNTSTPLHKSSTETILIKRGSPTPSSLISSPSSIRSPIPKEEPAAKKHKMPKRNVPSKVKAMMGGVVAIQQKSVVSKTKSAEKTESIIGKISKKSAEEAKSRLKDIKSKVFSGGSVRSGEQKPKETRTSNVRQSNAQKSPNNKQ